MNSIFKGAKFGDKFLCKNGAIAIFHRAFMKSSYYLIVAEICDRIEYNPDGTCRGDSEWDIISHYQEQIDEEKLDELAKVYYLEQLHKQESTYENTKYCMSDFKAGYHNAFNNKVNNS